jgi:hypothetical protein
MRSREFITESARLWTAKVRISQPNYVGYVDVQVWAPNTQIARTILKQQYNIEDHHVGSIKMKAKEFVKEVAPVNKAWNSNTGEIYEAANDAARALYCLGVLTNPAFVRSEGAFAQQLLRTLGDPEDYEESAKMALSTLSEYGARLNYNRNSPRVFTLVIPKMPAHTFDIREVVDSAMEMSD